MLPRIQPMRLRLVKEPFDHPDYIFELKHDGFRALVYIDNDECRLVSRKLKSMRFEYLRMALAKLPAGNAILPWRNRLEWTNTASADSPPYSRPRAETRHCSMRST